MKKILCTLMIFCVIIFSVNSKVFAYDVYIGTFRDGNNAYLMTETVRGRRNDFYFTVRSIKGRNQFFIDYNIWQNNYGDWYFSNSQGFNKMITYQTPIARDLRDYILKNF